MKKFLARIVAKLFSRIIDVYNDDEIISKEERRSLSAAKVSNSTAVSAEELKKVLGEFSKDIAKKAKSPSADSSSKKYSKTYDLLIYGPISNSGLTTQAKQLARVFAAFGLEFRITYYVKPTIQCELNKYWLSDEKNVGKPKAIFFLERFPKFNLVGTPYEKAVKIFYMNLDWMRENEMSQARKWAEYIVFPNEHRNDWVKENFPRAGFQILKWPSANGILLRRRALGENEKIKILYVGNDYDEKSRKSPLQTIEAILNCTNEFLSFTLKFRSGLPQVIHDSLINHPLVEELIIGDISDDQMYHIYKDAHINLIPNQSEGNGLSIIESISMGVIPACLDGYPMKYNVQETFGYLLRCIEIQPKEKTNQYFIETQYISSFLNQLKPDHLNTKLDNLYRQQSVYIEREKKFYSDLKELFLHVGLINFSKLPNINREIAKLTSEQNIDVFLTTYNRPQYLKRTLERVLEAKEYYNKGNIRISVIIDKADPESYQVLAPYVREIDILSTNQTKGLPFSYNMMLAYEKMTAERTELFADFICYIQDDCYITDAKNYFDIMVKVQNEGLVKGRIGYTSGFYTPIHPGFELREFDYYHILLSDSIDGKNIFGSRELFHEVGKLSWYFNNGERKGNPGPKRGSHFDLWQWKESPNSTKKQELVNVIVPGLCSTLSKSAQESTWNNPFDSEEGISARVKLGNIYNTRKNYPELKEHHFYPQLPESKATLSNNFEDETQVLAEKAD